MPAQEVAACSNAQVAASLDEAIQNLLALDADLLAVGVHERTVAARLALHLQDQFQDWHVDCEYNREGHDPKEINLPDGVTRPYPDIIVHKRRRRAAGANLLVIELKLTSNMNPARELRDLQKLPAYIESLGYRHAAFVKLANRPLQPGVVGIRWFEPTPRAVRIRRQPR